MLTWAFCVSSLGKQFSILFVYRKPYQVDQELRLVYHLGKGVINAPFLFTIQKIIIRCALSYGLLTTGKNLEKDLISLLETPTNTPELSILLIVL